MEEKLEKEKNNAEFWSKIISVSIIVISWLVLLGIKIGSDISLKAPLIITIIITIISIIIFFGKKIYHLTDKLKEKEKVAEPLTKEQISVILEKEVKNMWNYIEKGVPIKRIPHNINNSIIYEHHLKLYREQEFDGETTDQIIILINATFPNLQPAILPSNCNPMDLKDKINRLSKNPENPDIEETETMTDAFGKPIQKTRRTSFSRPVEQKEASVV